MIDQSANADALHWRFSFLQTLRETGNVSAAARHVGKSRAAVYRARKQEIIAPNQKSSPQTKN